MLIALFGRLGIGNLLHCLSSEKHDGVSAVTLILALCLFRINSTDLFNPYSQQFHGLLRVDKNCFYRMMQRPVMNRRRLQTGMVSRFQAILRKEGAEDAAQPGTYLPYQIPEE